MIPTRVLDGDSSIDGGGNEDVNGGEDHVAT